MFINLDSYLNIHQISIQAECICMFDACHLSSSDFRFYKLQLVDMISAWAICFSDSSLTIL